MGEPFGRWSNPPSRNEYDDSSALRRSNSFARPSGKSIYNQRKDYGQTLLNPQSHFQHHVEHLLTVRLERDIRSTDDCLAHLKVLEAQGRVWGQDLILQVKDQELVLRDVESKEELESYPLGSVQGCSAALDVCGYNSVLAISVQERSPPGSSVLLFQCDHLGAETLKSSLEKLVKQWKEEQRSQHGHRSNLDMPPSLVPPYAQGPSAAPERWAETPEPDFPGPPRHGLPSSHYSLPDTQQMPWTNPPGQVMSNVDRDVEVLNHVLSDLDLFVVRLKTALGLVNTANLKKRKKKNKGLPTQGDYTDFFQKVKYALNLMGKTHWHVREPDPSELLHLIFTALSFVSAPKIRSQSPTQGYGGCCSITAHPEQVLDHCPNPSLARAVEAPLLVPEAVELLEKTLHQGDYSTWKSLGIAWNKTRAEYPNGELVPRYIPVFSDGWLPPPMEQSPATGWRDNPGQAAPFPAQELVRALYEFQGRNPQELSVRMGDILQVLDQRKKWWLVQDGRGEKGYVPSNVLEPLGQGYGRGWHSPSQDSPPNLHPDSSPAEVTAWLKDKGFSRITVRCLGVLTGHQLLQMNPAELRAVCPEEWRRVLFKLSSVRTSLGVRDPQPRMGPRD
ncbi:epidermal growth factor receptor kinase substrate 8-like protein 3 [Gavia stellata]|uniref:epidermal growth factor receptor kinase substrate 8-like protein 3 n=1 Tax=Gavia stellata TaxID=37040 RepID=UPI0028A134DF|nr:epidermal growth factor receptor kinase substrate 8-like protein 3 [Gavia stellata]